MVSPTPPDFFAESANKSATPPDAQVGLPSEEEIRRVLIAHFVENTGFQTVNEDDTKTSVAAYYGGHWVGLRIYPIARAILDLIRPAFEAKEREYALASEGRAAFAARALSAEAKLAQAVEDEREACAATVEDMAAEHAVSPDIERHVIAAHDFSRAATAIRARSAAARGEKT